MTTIQTIEDHRLATLALNNVKGVGPKFFSEMYSLSTNEEDNVQLYNHYLPKNATVYSQFVKNYLELSKKKLSHNFWCFWEKGYPPLLKLAPDFPPIIYYKSEAYPANIDYKKYIGVVGTRKVGEEFKSLTAELANFLAINGYILVSGLAMGIDTIALEEASSIGSCVAVIPGGVDKATPRTNTYLYNKILKNGGMILSEDSSGEVSKYNFPRRNRIIAGMCRALVMVQAPVKSGALITAKQAHSYAKEVFTFPGSIYDIRVGGNNYLLKTNIAQAISAVTDLKYFFPEMKYTYKIEQKLPSKLTDEELSLYKLLSQEQLDLEELCVKIDRNTGDVLSLLGSLEVQGLVSLDISTGKYIIKYE